ncbi:hypothetical protein [Leuconostoc citreum]|uniref:hypothetical protein n=1 Tax=Leuconostoc citreum TaxID=33964 RepID=UPI00313453C5
MEYLKWIKWWLSTNISATNVLLALLIIILVAYLTKSPDWLRDKFQKKNAQVLQIEQFYRQNSGKDLKNIQNEWLTTFNNMGNDFTELKAQNLVKKTIAVASGRTTIILTSMLQHIYQNDGKTDDTYTLMVYFASIVDSLKKDFTGEDTGAFVLIQSKINDFYNELPKYKKAYKIYKKEIKRTKRGIKMPLSVKLVIIAAVLIVILALVIYFINKM